MWCTYPSPNPLYSPPHPLPHTKTFVRPYPQLLGNCFLLVKNYGNLINYEILILSSNQIIFTLLGMFQLALWHTIFCWLCREYPRGINKHAVICCKRERMLHHWRVYSWKEQWWKAVQHLDLIWTWWHNACQTQKGQQWKNMSVTNMGAMQGMQARIPNS